MPTVLISGVFDPLHAGHLAYIDYAKRLGTVSVVVSDDASKHPPLVPLEDRRAWLRAVGCNVSSQDSVAAEIVFRRPRADFFLKGKEWRGRLPPEIEAACEQTGTHIIYCDTRRNSSSALLAHYERARNAEKLAAFERFVQGQTPAEKPWEPVTDYSRETRRSIEAPQADILAEVFAGCSVLDYGCGFGYLVELLKERGMDAHGWDPQQTSGDYAPGYGFGLVICREVLEHLPVREAARTISELVIRADRYVYVTTRFCAGSHLLDVDGSDDLDPTHITMLNQDLLRTLFVLEGCTRRADLEAKLDHKQLGRVLVYEVPK
jgi:cytidyltransferase-like protein